MPKGKRGTGKPSPLSAFERRAQLLLIMKLRFGEFKGEAVNSLRSERSVYTGNGKDSNTGECKRGSMSAQHESVAIQKTSATFWRYSLRAAIGFISFLVDFGGEEGKPNWIRPEKK